jgi:hypothetical protein
MYIIIFSFIFLGACDDGFLTVELEINGYPNKLFYVAGIDNSINLEGGTIRIITKDNRYTGIEQMEEEFKWEEIIHDIDFNTAGIYIVYIKSYKYTVSFPVQVVSQEELIDIVNSLN